MLLIDCSSCWFLITCILVCAHVIINDYVFYDLLGIDHKSGIILGFSF